MIEFIAAVITIGLVMLAMSIGVIFGNRQIKGSCGGLNNLKKVLGFTPWERKNDFLRAMTTF